MKWTVNGGTDGGKSRWLCVYACACVRSAFVTFRRIPRRERWRRPVLPPLGLQIACQLDHNRDPGIAR